MTNEKIIEFVKQVTDKKIRWVGWDEKDWFIPNGQINVNTDQFYGEAFYKGIHRETDNWNVSCGFKENPDEYDLAGRWEFVREEAETFREQAEIKTVTELQVKQAEIIKELPDVRLELEDLCHVMDAAKENILNIIERLTIK